jgi:hypothetical protein
MNKICLVQELQFVAFAPQVLHRATLASLSQLISDPEPVALALEFIVKNGLFEDFCTPLYEDTQLVMALFGNTDEVVVVNSQRLSATHTLPRTGKGM